MLFPKIKGNWQVWITVSKHCTCKELGATVWWAVLPLPLTAQPCSWWGVWKWTLKTSYLCGNGSLAHSVCAAKTGRKRVSERKWKPTWSHSWGLLRCSGLSPDCHVLSPNKTHRAFPGPTSPPPNIHPPSPRQLLGKHAWQNLNRKRSSSFLYPGF